LKDYRIKAHLDAVPVNDIDLQHIPNVLGYKKHRILVVDSTGVYSFPIPYVPTYILLRTSPDINLDRLINLYPKITIIADGSNYRSDIERWRKTCLKKNIPFHSTYEKGAYTMY